MLKPRILADAAGPPVVGHPQMLCKTFQQVAAVYPDNRAVVSMYQGVARSSDNLNASKEDSLTWTYAQLNEKAEKLALKLSARGIQPGMRLAVFLPNSAEWTLLYWASVKLGSVFISLDAHAVQREKEVHHYLDTTKPSALFVTSPAIAQMLLERNSSDIKDITLKVITEPTVSQIDGWDNWEHLFPEELGSLNGHQPLYEETCSGSIAASTSSDPILPTSSDDEVRNQTQNNLGSDVHIVFTSGSSGLPKACSITNKNIWAAAVAADNCDPKCNTDVVMAVAPPSHTMGLCYMLHTWMNGAALVIPAPAFEAKTTLDAIASMKCTHVPAIPTMILALIEQPTFHPEKTQSLRMVLLGSTIIPPSAVATATDRKLIGASDTVVAYGLTEGTPICGASSKEGMKCDHGAVSVGPPLPGVRVRICENQSRRVLARGQTGELHYGGDLVINGYLYGDNQCFYDDPSGHWMATGDEAMMDEEGNVFVFGRYKDIIIRGGENLSPGLIENCLSRAGTFGQIVGVPDVIAGEVPIAVVQVADKGQIPRAKIRDLIMDSLGRTCLPTAYLTLAELGLTTFPLTALGKVQKSKLRDIVLDYMSQQSLNDQFTGSNDRNEGGNGTTETLIYSILATLIGKSEQAVPRDQPLSTMLDSINMLRLQASIQKATGKKLPMDGTFIDSTVSLLATKVDEATTEDSSILRKEGRKGPPTATDMVHTHGDLRSAVRTRAQAEVLLTKHGMSWDEIEDVFPIPDLSSRGFEAMRPMAFSLRLTFASRSTSPSLLREALKKTLEKWSIFRSLAIKFDNTPLFVIPRACTALSAASIVDLPAVESLELLCKIRFPQHWGDNVHLSNGVPLVRFAISSVKDADCTGLVMLAHHSTFDAISLQAFSRDLEANIRNDGVSEPYTNYKLFADTYYQYSSSIPAQLSIAYHVNRLRGLGSLRENLWPPQRCPGWFIGDDTGHRIPSVLQNPRHEPRSQIDNDGGYAGMVGIRRIAPLSGVATLTSKYNIFTPVLFKAACAILNSHLSDSSEVCFANTQAGRAWPFLDPSIANHLPNPVTIAGSTLGLVVNRIQIHPTATVGSLLTHLEEEQHHLTAHAHAPLTAITAQLNPADAAACTGARRQMLNWNPIAGETASQKGKAKMEVVQVEAFTEVMLEWHCGMVGENAILTARWDGAQFGKDTVEGWAEGFMKVLEWVSRAENWEKKLGEVELRRSFALGSDNAPNGGEPLN